MCPEVIAEAKIQPWGIIGMQVCALRLTTVLGVAGSNPKWGKNRLVGVSTPSP